LSYGITQYLPPDRGDSHAFTPGILPVLICRPWKDENAPIHLLFSNLAFGLALDRRASL